MIRDISTATLFNSIFMPGESFKRLAETEPNVGYIIARFGLWLLVLPPLFAWLGAWVFGWRLGAAEPLRLDTLSLTYISLGYFFVLLFGLISTAIISRWMAVTYHANASLGRHIALISIVAEPLAFASVVHLFPDVFLNLLVLIPAMLWSMYLLYTGIPVALETSPEQGMLMASSLVAWLLVAAVSLLGITMALWTLGFGPLLGV